MLQRYLRFRILNFVTDQFASRPASLSGLALSHMIPPEEITDTQIGVAIWLLLWWIASSFAGSLVTMGLYQHADWWNLVQYSGPRTPLPHIREYPVRRRKNPQKPPLSDEKKQPNDTYTAEWKILTRLQSVSHATGKENSTLLTRERVPSRYLKGCGQAAQQRAARAAARRRRSGVGDARGRGSARRGSRRSLPASSTGAAAAGASAEQQQRATTSNRRRAAA